MSHPRTQLQRVGSPDTEDNDRVRHPQTENDRNQKDTDETASWKRCDRPWFALLEFALLVEVPREIADERDSTDRTVTPTGNKTKMNGFVEISTLLIHSAPKQKSNEWMHLSPFYTRMHGEWLRYAKSTSQFHWRFLLVRDVRGFQVNPLCRHDITRSDRQIGNHSSLRMGTRRCVSWPCFGHSCRCPLKKRGWCVPQVPFYTRRRSLACVIGVHLPMSSALGICIHASRHRVTLKAFP